MKRGDVVVVAASGDYGKPRPAVVVQSDVLPEAHVSVILCQFTSDPTPGDYRVPVAPSPDNGLRKRSQIMADKPMTVRRHRVGAMIGRLAAEDLHRLDIAIAFAMGLFDGA